MEYAPCPMSQSDHEPREPHAPTSASSETNTKVELTGRTRFVATPLAVMWGTVPGLAGFFALGFIASLNDRIRAFGEPTLGGQGWWVYVGLFAVCSGLGLLPTYAMSMIGGWIFGATAGTAGAVAGFMGGAIIGYVVTIAAGGEGFRAWLDANPKAKAIREAFLGSGQGRMLGTIIVLRFPPASPFALMNLVLASAGATLLPYTIGTLIGMTPRTAIAAVIAATAASSGEADFQSILRNRPLEMIIGIAVTLAIVMALAHIGQRVLERAGLAQPKAPR
jgi:uncharacterized membrane protein YdjX (TVP38/TMEM64 family)